LETVDAGLSDYYMAEEMHGTYRGMMMPFSENGVFF
jgi:hypothetical protein